jgi:FMN phosphatase YigB (HAD superfamily)
VISVVIFDLDETLADTGSLPSGRRVPSQVLAPGFPGREWVIDKSLADLPGELICRGYLVSIATRAPQPYASTLVHLLGVDTQELWASCGGGVAKATRITHELQQLRISPSECIYVGDGEHDRQIAAAVGCKYIHVDTARSGSLLASLPSLTDIPHYRRPPRWTDGAFREITGVFGELGSQVSHGRYFQLSNRLNIEGRTALALAMLQVVPQSRFRRDNQITLFSNLRSEHSSCIVQTRPFLHVDSRIVTKVELRRDAELRRAYLEGLGRCIKGIRCQLEVGTTTVEVRSVLDYQTAWGRALGVVKNYGNHDGNLKFRSGPEPELGALDFIADVVAAQMLDLGDSIIVPTPSHPYSEHQPGEVSRRLAYLVAARMNLPVAEILQRQGSDYVSRSGTVTVPSLEGRRGRAVLIEDQITTGNSINKAVTALSLLPNDRLRQPVVVSYSVSRRILERSNAVIPPAIEHCGMTLMTERIGLDCLCGRSA